MISQNRLSHGHELITPPNIKEITLAPANVKENFEDDCKSPINLVHDFAQFCLRSSVIDTHLLVSASKLLLIPRTKLTRSWKYPFPWLHQVSDWNNLPHNNKQKASIE